ncbi:MULTISPECIES: fimbrial protein [unclassified Enterobacter]|uniref:fimbrial protein n=1 Tax=unclassified Enterobacter TaxID=2608935 RepID=UPI002366C900|nr:MULTISPECIES: fimbrial protein [unclassified Enterobacter]
MKKMCKTIVGIVLAVFSCYASATICLSSDYSPTLTWDKIQADASLVPATGKVPFAEGTLHVYSICQGGYGGTVYMNYSGDTNLSAEGITYKLFTSSDDEIPMNRDAWIGEVPQNGNGDKIYAIDLNLKIKLYREETSRRLTWSGLREVTDFGTNTLRFKDYANNPNSYITNSIPLSPTLQVKVQRCQFARVNTLVDLGIVEAGSDGEYVPFSIDLNNCPARTNPEYWGVRIFIDDPNSSEMNTQLIRPASDSVSGYGVGIDVENNGSFSPMRFNTGDTATLLSLSNYDYTSGTTSVNFRAILKRNGDKISAGKFKATGNLHIVFD